MKMTKTKEIGKTFTVKKTCNEWKINLENLINSLKEEELSFKSKKFFRRIIRKIKN